MDRTDRVSFEKMQRYLRCENLIKNRNILREREIRVEQDWEKSWLTCVAGGETGYHGEVRRGNDRREPGEIRDQTVFRPEAPARGLGMGQHQTPRRLDCFLASTAKSIRVFGLLFQFFYVRLFSLIGTPYYWKVVYSRLINSSIPLAPTFPL